MRVEEAFTVAVDRSRAKEAHGRWIPVDYWLEKTRYILSESDIAIKLRPKQLITRLEKKGFLDRVFSLPADKESFGAIVKIHSNNSKVTLDDGGKEKTIYFLFLETNKLKPPSLSTHSMWQGYYDSFLRRQTHRLRVERRSSNQEEEELRVATTTILVEEPPAPRPVTPTGEPIDSDIKTLLQPFLDGVNDLKPNSGGNRALRKAIQAFGCNLQYIDNEAVANVKKADKDISSLQAIASHRCFLDRHCCPPRTSCIQAFLALAQKVDKEAPEVDIFQLTKAGGAKGSGIKLVPVIPTTEPRYFNDNAKQWLPRVLDATVVDGSRYHACFHL
jgi:hypothetical protein